MEVNCENCRHRRMCVFFQEATQAYRDFPIRLSRVREASWQLWLKELPNICEHFDKIRIKEQWYRDKNGVLLGHKPLKLWYPNQEPKEDVHTNNPWEFCPECKKRGCMIDASEFKYFHGTYVPK